MAQCSKGRGSAEGDLPDLAVAHVGDVERTVRAEGQATGHAEGGRVGGTVVVAAAARAGEDGGLSVGGDLQDAVGVGVGHVAVAGAVGGDVCGLREVDRVFGGRGDLVTGDEARLAVVAVVGDVHVGVGVDCDCVREGELGGHRHAVCVAHFAGAGDGGDAGGRGAGSRRVDLD